MGFNRTICIELKTNDVNFSLSVIGRRVFNGDSYDSRIRNVARLTIFFGSCGFHRTIFIGLKTDGVTFLLSFLGRRVFNGDSYDGWIRNVVRLTSSLGRVVSTALFVSG